MPYKLSTVQLWVFDQDEALKFYTEKLGMEVRQDVTMAELGGFRWLTVGPVGQPDIAITLMALPGEPIMDDKTAGQVRDLTAKGFTGTVFLTTDDCQASYEELSARGSSSSTSRSSSRTGSTRRSATRSATTSASRRSSTWAEHTEMGCAASAPRFPWSHLRRRSTVATV
ncbi:VOC family protein [Actinocrispum sp. NPDC049592]|uniref:VOC family protein n=1 Tax=Actinocrispum sp. NPDC049592 TaxID=3154835 RepID=UPI0034416685